MPKFRYVAMDAKGHEVQEVIEAENQARAVALIKERGLYPTSVEDASSRSSRGGVSAADAVRQKTDGSAKGGGLKTEIKLPKFLEAMFAGKVKLGELVILTRQFATLVSAGLPLLKGLHILQKQEKNRALRAAITAMAESVEGGSTFAEAVAQHPRIFNNFFVNMIKAGEVSGAMETVLIRLAEFMEKAQKIRNKVKGAMVYPVVVLTLAIGIVTVLMIVVIPRFKEIFTEMLAGEKLPLVTQFVMNMSDTIKTRGLYVVAVVAVIVIVSKIMARSKAGQFWLDRFKLSAPIFGDLMRKTAIANFTRTLGTLLTGGVPILQALNIVREIAGNAVISKAVLEVHDSVKEGESMVAPLEASGAFPSMVVSMIQVGEETGALPDMLMKIADTYENEVDTAVEALTSVIEPLLIIFLAVVVGTIVIAMFMPLIKIVEKLA